MKKRITIRDIAAMLSLTPSSVSRALSNHPGISETTKQRVQEAVKELGYVPNLHARYFRQKISFDCAYSPGI
ncbi:MAG: LacI family DNA-binding transcriptional regulator [Saprospiraceae bacterium]|nr:LacI family DNA-binding transcriptional regulator [Saprospiraceae bacterium]